MSTPIESPDGEWTPKRLSEIRRHEGRDPMPSCVTCGAVYSGNLNCERCLLTWNDPEGSDGSLRRWFLRYARTRVEWSPYGNHLERCIGCGEPFGESGSESEECSGGICHRCGGCAALCLDESNEGREESPRVPLSAWHDDEAAARAAYDEARSRAW